MDVADAIQSYLATGDRRDAVAAVPVGASSTIIAGVHSTDTVQAAAEAATYFADLDIAVGEFAVIHRTWATSTAWGDHLAADPSALPAVIAVHIDEHGTREWVAYRHVADDGSVRYSDAAPFRRGH